MENRHLRALELDKVLELLASECSCQDAAEQARALEPSSDIDEVRQRLSESWDCHMLVGRFGSPTFGGVRSVANSLRRAEAGACLSIPELLRISEVLRIIRAVREWRGHCEGVQTSFDELFMGLTPNKYLEESINSAIMNEEELNDNASSNLASIRRKIRSAQSRVRDKLDGILRSSGRFLQDSIITQRNGRFVVPVRAECRGDVPGLVHDTSSSGATVFVEPMAVVEANNEIRVLQGEEREEIDRILTALSDEAGSFAGSICSSYDVLIKLDLIFAKARLGFDMNASMPALNDEGRIRFNKARHPLINRDKVVPTDIRLGKEFDTLVITGPNTGGKTVALKTIGLLSAMAMCGLLIPVGDESEASVFDRVLADIGDEQSIEQSLSTFSAHMTNIISIIDATDDKTLVLIDELGAGTDPIEGAALATAILERLRGQGARIAATTHYSELKSYAINTPGVENGCCEFDVATLRPTYRLLIGVPGRSNAFAISERLGIPKEVVDRARELVSSESTRFEEVVEKLEQRRQGLESEQHEAQRLRIEAQKAKDEASRASERLEKERQNILELARGEAARIVSAARGQSDALLEEIDKLRKELKSSADVAALNARAKAELRGRIRELQDTADPVIEQEQGDYTLPRPLKEGDTVLVTELGKNATVTRVLESSGQVEVQAGIIKLRVRIENVRLVEGAKVKKELPKYRSQKKEPVNQAPTEVDVRGMTVDEAEIEADRVIDQALLLGLGEVRVIHGKGTGALRAGLHQHFRKHPNVRTFRIGVYGEGAEGVTILELK